MNKDLSALPKYILKREITGMEIALNYEQLNAEYSMLMSVLEASVSRHLIDGHYTCIWANDYYYDLIR